MRPGPSKNCNPCIRIDLAVLFALRLMPQGQLEVGPVEGLARHQLIGARRLHRVRQLIGVFKADPSRGSSVKNDLPKLNEIRDMPQDCGGEL
jgi:hypothetical protein